MPGSPKRILFVGAALAAALVAPATSTLAGPAADISLEVERYFDQQYGGELLRFSGAIAKATPGESVTILHRRCGQGFFTAIDGTTTREGGRYETATGGTPQSGTFRARWNGSLSPAVVVRTPVQIMVNRQATGRYLLRFSADSNIAGRPVELQRLAGGRWVRVMRARLRTYGVAGYGGGFEARFLIRKPGLRLRAVVPKQTAGPCHLAAVSRTFVS